MINNKEINSEYISYIEFNKCLKGLQELIIDWWIPHKGDIYVHESDTTTLREVGSDTNIDKRNLCPILSIEQLKNIISYLGHDIIMIDKTNPENTVVVIYSNKLRTHKYLNYKTNQLHRLYWLVINDLYDLYDAHISHCCEIHGCKYGDINCPVEHGLIKQKYLCEGCEDLGITKIDDIDQLKRYNCCNDMVGLKENLYNVVWLKKMKVCPFCLTKIQ